MWISEEEKKQAIYIVEASLLTQRLFMSEENKQLVSRAIEELEDIPVEEEDELA